MDIGEAHPAAGKTADKGIRILQPYRWIGGASPFERIRTCLRKKPRKRLAIVLTQKASSARSMFTNVLYPSATIIELAFF